MDEEKAFDLLKEKIFNERGLDVNQYKENYLKRRIAVRMRALQINSYQDYIYFLDNNKDEYNLLFDKLTINVTQFFRDPEMFVAFENEVLPQLFSNGKNDLKIWSAGCSSGEEPYSIAISIEESKEKFGFGKVNYEIIATDIDNDALFQANEGIYNLKAIENIAELRKNKYFIKKDNKYLIIDKIKNHVKFIRHNLMDDFKNDFFDIVFCRNVIIYFIKDLQKKVLQSFYDSLKEDGFLILGKTETMLLSFRDKFKCFNLRERIFKKEKK